jgi:hypothetical protein
MVEECFDGDAFWVWIGRVMRDKANKATWMMLVLLYASRFENWRNV